MSQQYCIPLSTPLEELWRETEAARKDPFLVQIVRQSTSPEIAAKEAERFDYPTYLCRQARLLGRIKELYWNAWSQEIEHPQVALSWPRTDEYPCEWEVEHYHGKLLYTNFGSLVVTKTEHEAAVLWDYALVDEYGKEVCYSKALGRDFSLRDGIVKVNCHFNSGSRVLPRNGLTISFSLGGRNLDFLRITDMQKVNWTRSNYHQGGKHPGLYISRRVVGGRRLEIHEIVVRPLTTTVTTDIPLLYCVQKWKDPSALFLETSFVKHAKDENQGLLWHCSTAYVFQGDISGYLTGPISGLQVVHKADYANTTSSGYRSPLSVVCQVLSKEDMKNYDVTHQPHEDSVEDVVSDIYKATPSGIDIVKTVVRMCDILHMNDNIYYDGSDQSMLVKAE
ncbi:MAG: hypothetical protein G01um101429_1006 [Parcubacteria group bacterium Gr01-1014_29]|nr:MAG: hypothetical protein G01um101429_1006 [Parcubacteria group bacterium Gr01-1014_29]